MFIVYSPEGQSFVGSVQQLPAIKVDPATRINKVDETLLKQLDVNSGKQEQNAPYSSALNAYKSISKTDRKLIVKAAELMSSPVITVNSSESIENAWKIMQDKQIKHLPVIDRGELVGICNQSSILGRVIIDKQGRLEGVKPELVSETMNEIVVTTSSDTDIRHVAQALTEMDIDALLIMDQNQDLKGIVTSSDLLRRLANEPPLELYT